MKHTYFVSGGKDSTAMLIRAIEEGNPVNEALFIDTTLEYPELYSYLDTLDEYLKQYDIKINRIITTKKPFHQRFYQIINRGPKKGNIRGFPYAGFANFCWIRREYKKFPKPNGNINYIGIAYDERHRTDRKAYTKGEYRFPLVEWKMSERDCIAFLRERDLLNPLYEMFNRLGCWLCPYQGRKSLYQLYLNYPHLWKQLLDYEEDSPQRFLADKRLSQLDKEFQHKSKQTTLIS